MRRTHCWERVPLCPPWGQTGVRVQHLPASQLGSQELLGHRPGAATGLQGSFQKPHEAASCISPPPNRINEIINKLIHEILTHIPSKNSLFTQILTLSVVPRP